MRAFPLVTLFATVLLFWVFGVTGWGLKVVADFFVGLLFIGLIGGGFGVVAWSWFRILGVGQKALTGYARGRV